MLGVVAVNAWSTAPVKASTLARRDFATPLTVVKSPPIQTEAPSEMTAYTVPLVLATKPGRSSPVERATAIMLSRSWNWLPLVAREKSPPT